MLVLTRRKNQKVLFPNLRMAVEVIDISGRQVRLGIDAPPEIRILRDELPSSETPLLALINEADTRRHLDAATLAIHLAQNQLGQGLPELAETALERVLERLEILESTLVHSRKPSHRTSLSLHETRAGYATRQPRDVILLHGSQVQRRFVTSV